MQPNLNVLKSPRVAEASKLVLIKQELIRLNLRLKLLQAVTKLEMRAWTKKELSEAYWLRNQIARLKKVFS